MNWLQDIRQFKGVSMRPLSLVWHFRAGLLAKHETLRGYMTHVPMVKWGDCQPVLDYLQCEYSCRFQPSTDVGALTDGHRARCYHEQAIGYHLISPDVTGRVGRRSTCDRPQEAARDQGSEAGKEGAAGKRLWVLVRLEYVTARSRSSSNRGASSRNSANNYIS